ncbi:MAG TPA: protoporphyrinogen oxidase [Thermomicrobiales bacterium]|nr:protoporphyrinogen oxidase [Thermomicrobiales bacterium]
MSDEERRPRVAVVGGGVAGLAAAWRLAQAADAPAVTLLEREPRLGGKIETERIDGFTIESGPDSFLAAKPRGVGLCQEIGLGERLLPIMPQPHRAYVLAQGRLHELPEGFSGLVPTKLGPVARSGLLSPRGKARLALDYALPPRRDDADESLGAFVRRRLGAEAFDRLVEPLMAGIYAGDGDRLSVLATFPQLRAAERAHGSLLRGMTARAAAPVGPPRPAFLTPADGLGELVAALESRLRAAGADLRLGAAVRSLLPIASEPGHRLRLATGETADFDAVVLATPSYAAGDLLREIDPALAAELRGIPHASSAIVSLAYRLADIQRPLDAHGYIVPRSEGGPILACTWTSLKWPRRAPEGYVLLRVFLGRWGQEDALAGSDAALVDTARAEVTTRLRASGDPVLVRVRRWPHGMPQYILGHLDRIARIDAALASHPRLALAGNAYRGVGIPDCIASGEAAADRALAPLLAGRPAALARAAD